MDRVFHKCNKIDTKINGQKILRKIKEEWKRETAVVHVYMIAKQYRQIFIMLTNKNKRSISSGSFFSLLQL